MREEIPNSVESEKAVIAALLAQKCDPDPHCSELLESDFYNPEHRLIYRAIKAVAKSGRPTALYIVSEELAKTSGYGVQIHLNNLLDIESLDRSTSIEHVEACVAEIKKHARSRECLRFLAEASSQLSSGHDVDKIIGDIQDRLREVERHGRLRDKFPIQFLNEMQSDYLFEAPPSKAMLLDYKDDEGGWGGFLPKSIVAMLAGAGGTGKTHLMGQLAISIATGTPFLEMFRPTTHCGRDNCGNVFLGLGENTQEDIHRLLYKASRNLRNIQPKLGEVDLLSKARGRIAPYSFCGQQAAFLDDGKPSLFFRQLKRRLIETAPEAGWALLIFDPVSRLMGTDAEKDNALATIFISLLEELTLDLPGNPTVLFAHHVNKASIGSKISSNSEGGAGVSQSAARGASALTDGVRWQCNFTKLASEKDGTSIDRAELEMTKSNHTRQAPTIVTRKDSDGFIRPLDKGNSKRVRY